MSLINCPECAHEVSTAASACPNCGRPIRSPVLERKVVAAPLPDSEGGFPTWALIPIGLLAAVLIFVVYIAFREGEGDSKTNVNVNLAGRRTTPDQRPPSGSSVPSSESTAADPPSQSTTIPGSSTAPPAAPPPEKGRVALSAKVISPNGSTSPARSTRFYLLEEDIETILREAKVEPIEGSTLVGSLGLASVFPERYGEFQRAAMRAIAANARHSGTTNGSGEADLSGVEPKGYYLFAIAKIGRGFALWNSRVSVFAGENRLNLSPLEVTEIADPNT